MVVVSVSLSVHIKAEVSVVLDVVVLALVPLDALVSLALEVSDHNSYSCVVVVSLLVRDGVVSLVPGSDGVSPRVECPPLVVVLRVVVSDSQAVLVVADVFVPEQSALACHLGLDLELDSVSKRVAWFGVGFSVHVPLLVPIGVACIPDAVSVMIVSCSVDVKALAASILDVHDWSWQESDLLKFLAALVKVPDNGVVAIVVEVASKLYRNDLSPVLHSTNGL